jgi:hypothetical protein
VEGFNSGIKGLKLYFPIIVLQEIVGNIFLLVVDVCLVQPTYFLLHILLLMVLTALHSAWCLFIDHAAH